MSRIPIYKKFRIQLYRSDGGWSFRILCGICFFVFMWNYTHEFMYWDKQTGITIGFIPWKLREGDFMPGKSWLRTTEKYSQYAP